MVATDGHATRENPNRATARCGLVGARRTRCIIHYRTLSTRRYPKIYVLLKLKLRSVSIKKLKKLRAAIVDNNNITRVGDFRHDEDTRRNLFRAQRVKISNSINGSAQKQYSDSMGIFIFIKSILKNEI